LEAAKGLSGPTEQPSNGYLKVDVSCHIINRLLLAITGGNVVVVVLLVEIARSTTPAPLSSFLNENHFIEQAAHSWFDNVFCVLCCLCSTGLSLCDCSVTVFCRLSRLLGVSCLLDLCYYPRYL
jgi:hypothetical protein